MVTRFRAYEHFMSCYDELLDSPDLRVPAANTSATNGTATNGTAANTSAADSTATSGAITKKPEFKKPATKKPTTKKPTAKKPATKKPTAKKPATKKPTTKKPTAKKPAADYSWRVVKQGKRYVLVRRFRHQTEFYRGPYIIKDDEETLPLAEKSYRESEAHSESLLWYAYRHSRGLVPLDPKKVQEYVEFERCGYYDQNV